MQSFFCRRVQVTTMGALMRRRVIALQSMQVQPHWWVTGLKLMLPKPITAEVRLEYTKMFQQVTLLAA